MPYLKTTWEDDVTPISAEKMNKIEQGISSLDRVKGTYVGDGTALRTIPLGFTPSAVFVCGEDGGTRYGTDSHYYNGGLALQGSAIKTGVTSAVDPVATVNEYILAITTNGFKVYYTQYKPDEAYIYQNIIGTNKNGKTLHYIAYR